MFPDHDLTTEEGREAALREAEDLTRENFHRDAAAIFAAVGAAEVLYAGASDHGDNEAYEALPDDE